jgi:hypothetical protein
MGQPCKRMPVALLLGGEGPGDSVPGDAIVDVRVFDYVAVVVIIDEGMPVDRVIDYETDADKQKAENYIALLRGREKASGLFGNRQRQNLTTEK